MANTTTLVLPIAAEGQTGKLTAINTGVQGVEADRATISIAKTTSPQTITTTQAQSGLVIITGTLTSNHILEIPNSMNHRLVVKNETTGNYTFKVRRQGQTATVTVPRNCSVPIRRLSNDVAIDERSNLIRPLVMAKRATSSQSISGSAVAIFNSESVDISGSYDTSTGVFTAPCAGVIQVMASGYFLFAGDGYIRVGIRKNGTIVVNKTTFAIGSMVMYEISADVAGTLAVAEGDTIDIYVEDGIGTGINLSSGAGESTLSIAYLSY